MSNNGHNSNGKHNGRLLTPMTGFTPKQRLFIHYYVETLNATRAAEMAGYKGSYSTLGVVGHDNLKKPKIREEIDRILGERMITPNEILDRLGSQAKAEYNDYIDPETKILDLKRLLKDGKGHLIKKMKMSRVSGRIAEVEFYDSQTALIQVGKFHKLWTDKIEQDTTVTVVKAYEQVSPDDWDNEDTNEIPALTT